MTETLREDEDFLIAAIKPNSPRGQDAIAIGSSRTAADVRPGNAKVKRNWIVR
ncbi:MAG: hypothetical protein IPP10_14795 [Candidatus Competibacteraceae bacterium]|nr:hypothetical protein [Candidatus Competibacteraceae bacterium]MBK8896432.1 hypothetical protein [Candidatus Competibacteraceae bacterium]MBK9952734.1 hypothetical protein [Candidatus Competibacteraceae bacterium]